MAPIRLTADYPYPPEAVWAALTEPAALRDWLMESDFKPVEGHDFTFRMPPRPGFDGVIRCRVVRVDPPRELVYTWLTSWLKEPSTVTWRLYRTTDGTRLELEHADLEQGVLGRLLKRMLSLGWGRMLKRDLRQAIANSRETPEAEA